MEEYFKISLGCFQN